MKVGPNLALRTAINALRDIVESERMPKGIPLTMTNAGVASTVCR